MNALLKILYGEATNGHPVQGRTTIDEDIHAVGVDGMTTAGSYYVTYHVAGVTMQKRFAVVVYGNARIALAEARKWRDHWKGTTEADRVKRFRPLPKKPVKPEHPNVEAARRDVATAMANYGHNVDPWYGERGAKL